MKHQKRQRLWTVSVSALALLSLLVGTSFACFQEMSSISGAEDCCRGHCQHVMAADVAAQCCQSHQAKFSQALLVSPSAKALTLVASALSIAWISPAIVGSPEHSWLHFPAEERPPPPPLYTLHCTRLI